MVLPLWPGVELGVIRLNPGEGLRVGVCGGMPSRLPVDAASLLLLDAMESRSRSFFFRPLLRCFTCKAPASGFLRKESSSG